MQVLISIQGMILIEEPYFNEPGFERTAGSGTGQQESERYNRRIQQHNLQHALLPALKKPPPAFKEALQ